MTLLILGGTGMLGQALLREARGRGLTALGAAREGADLSCDLTDPAALERLFEAYGPKTVINAAALTDLNRCEAEPGAAYAVNGRAAGVTAELCRRAGARLVQVSTDHYFTGDGRALHDERSPVRLLNEYARSKYVGEALASTLPGSLVLRTNIAGWRGWAGRPTFVEWLFAAVEQDAALTLFDDYFTSTLDCASFARACLDLLDAGASGLLNLASSEASSKLEFAEALARRLGKVLTRCTAGSVRELTPRRAESLGLDVRAAENILGYRFPGLDQVIDALVTEKQTKCDMPLHS